MPKSAATIRDVAQVAQLSVASVSRALNSHGNVHPDTRARVLDAVALLGYVPNAAARSLSMARSHAIGVVLPDLHGEFFGELVRGIDAAASARGHLLLVSNMHANPALAREAMAAMRGRIDGLIVMAPGLTAAELEAALPPSLPAVLVNSPARPGRHGLRIDNVTGVTTMVEHLLAIGCRRIVHLAGMVENIDGAERRDAYRAAMQAQDGSLSATVLDGDFTDAAGERLVTELIASGAPFDAIFAANDMMALGALQALRAADRADVAVAGFDDIPLARFLDLTTMRADMAGIGAAAATRLLDELAGGTAERTVERIVPDLVVRASTRRPEVEGKRPIR